MKNEFEPRIENEPIPGETVLKIIVGRHGPKASAAGEKNELADYFTEHVSAGFEKMDIPDNAGVAHVATSPEGRASNTAEIINTLIDDKASRTKEDTTEDERLLVRYNPKSEDPRYVHDTQLLIEKQKATVGEIRSEVEEELAQGEYSQEEIEAEVRSRMDSRIFAEMVEDERLAPDERELQVPYTELADDVAGRYARYARKIGYLKRMRDSAGQQPKDVPYLQIDVSHSYPTTAFLKKYLVFDDGVQAEKLSAEEFFDRTGGMIRESGNFSIDYVVNEGGEVIMNVSGSFDPETPFKGTIDMNALEEIEPRLNKNNE